MGWTNLYEDIKKRGKFVFTLVSVGLRKTLLAVKKYALVLVYFFGLSLFLFREVLGREGVVAFEDLAPFFSQDQFIEFQFGSWVKYTQGIPFRARYNLLFLWPRYLPFLEVSLILITTLAGLLFFFSTITILKLILKEKLGNRHLALAVLSSTYALFILLPAKLSHFNTMVLGAAFMCLALSLFIKALLETSLPNSLFLTLAAVTLLHMTPSIHMIGIFYVAISFLVLISVFVGIKLKKSLLLLAIVFLVHAAPYWIYMFFVTGAGIKTGIYSSVPASYGIIESGSVNPLRFASSSHNSQISKYLTGSWAPPISILLLFQAGFCGLSLIKFRKSKTVQMLFSLYLLAFFFALGFWSPISGYTVVLEISELVPFLKPITRATLFEVLRRPQRWLFLETYVRMVLFGLSAMTTLSLMRTKLPLKMSIKRKKVVKTFSCILIVLFMVSPFLVYPYNLVFTGDFGGALKPVVVPQGMEEIKRIVKDSNIGAQKIVSLPLIGRKEIVEWDGGKLFLPDEFYNFYFETPSIEGTGSVSILNQLSMLFGYRLLYNNLSASAGRYFSQLGVKYIFFHNDMASRVDESRILLSSLQSQTDILLKYQDEEYYLFEVVNKEANVRSPTESKSLIFFYDTLWTPWRFLSEFDLASQDAVFVDLVSGDTSWTQFNSIVKRIGNSTAIFLPGVYFEDKDVVLSLLLKETGILVKPDFFDLLEFEKNGWIVPFSPGRYKRYFDYLDEFGIYGEFGATDGVFAASSEKKVNVTFNFDVPKKDSYGIYVKLHAPDGARVLFKVDGRSERITINNTATYKFVKIFEGELSKGRHKVFIKKLDSRPLVVNLVYLIGSEEFSTYVNEFRDLVINRHILLSDEYSDIVDHVSKVGYPRDGTIYFYNGDLYSENLAFRVKDGTYTPMKAVYSRSVLILDETSSSGDVEPIHLPEEKIIRLATLTYVTYIAMLWVGLGLVAMRLRLRTGMTLPKQKKAEITPREPSLTVKEYKLLCALIGLSVAFVVLLWRLILWLLS